MFKYLTKDDGEKLLLWIKIQKSRLLNQTNAEADDVLDWCQRFEEVIYHAMPEL